MSEEEVFSFQLSLIKMMMSLEDAFITIAKGAGIAPSFCLGYPWSCFCVTDSL